MARPRRIDADVIAHAKMIVSEACDVDTLRRAQALLLPALLGATLQQTAAVLGVSRATVPRLQARLRAQISASPVQHPSWGGRRRESMSVEEERAFLEPWAQACKTGSVLVVSPIRAALAQKLGHPVTASVVYRLLARHGWRKVAPDTRPPKSDPKVQQDWKENCPKHWQRC